MGFGKISEGNGGVDAGRIMDDKASFGDDEKQQDHNREVQIELGRKDVRDREFESFEE